MNVSILAPSGRKSLLRAKGRRAFTLIELLTVIVIIGLLATLLIPSATKMIGKARDAKCLHNLHQIYTGIRLYAADNENQVPMSSTNPNGLKWHYYIQDYLETAFGTANISQVFKCPADTSIGSVLTYDMNRNLEDKRFTGIAGNVLLLTESTGTYSIKGDATSIGTLLYNHLGGKAVNVLYVNGSVESRLSVSNSTTDPKLWIP